MKKKYLILFIFVTNFLASQIVIKHDTINGYAGYKFSEAIISNNNKWILFAEKLDISTNTNFNTFLVTLNKGQSFSTLNFPYPSNFKVYGIQNKLDTIILHGITSNGITKILKSYDFGINWVVYNSPFNLKVRELAKLPNNKNWLLCYDDNNLFKPLAYIYETDDNFASFQIKLQDTIQVINNYYIKHNYLSAISKDTVYLIANKFNNVNNSVTCILKKTTNSGINWVEKILPISENFSPVYIKYFNSNKIMIFSQFGHDKMDFQTNDAFNTIFLDTVSSNSHALGTVNNWITCANKQDFLTYTESEVSVYGVQNIFYLNNNLHYGNFFCNENFSQNTKCNYNISSNGEITIGGIVTNNDSTFIAYTLVENLCSIISGYEKVTIKNDNFTLYPNPISNGHFKLKTNSTSNPDNLKIVINDCFGKILIEKGIIIESDIDITKLAKGLYFLKIFQSDILIRTIKFVLI